MDKKVLDEAEFAALCEWFEEPNGDGLPDGAPCVEEWRRRMRAALLAGMKVLLGEPVAWQYLSQASDEPRWTLVGKPMADVFAKHGNPVRPLYAPSLGEGDGR